MKVRPVCASCLFERAIYEADLVLTDDEEKIRFLKELLKYASENFDLDVTPAKIGTERERILVRISGNDDPYLELKRSSNGIAVKLLDIAKKAHERSQDRLKTLLTIVAAGNSMEYGVRGHNFDHNAFRSEFEKLLREPISGNVEEVLNSIKNASKILYLTDNAGEIVFDLFFIEELINMGKEVIISPKSSPILNDATIGDVNEFADFDIQIIPSGSFVGLSLGEADADFLGYLWDEDYLIIAKGMGNYEMISEFETELSGRLIYILRAKCAPVADSIGVNQGDLVAMLVNGGGV